MNKQIGRIAITAALLAGVLLTRYAISYFTSDPNDPSSHGVDQKTTLVFWASVITLEREAFWEEVVEDFNAKNPDIHVNFLGIPGDLNAYNNKVNVAIAAGQAPDIMNNFTTDIVSRGALEPLDNYFDNWEGRNKITPRSIASTRSADPRENKLYGLPYGILPWMMWVRTDWLKEQDLPLPVTWDQFFDDANKLTNLSKGRYGYGIRGGSGSASTLEMLMYAYSGITNYFTEDGKATINDARHVQFLEKYLGGFHVNTPEDDLGKGWTELAASFQSGKVGMIFHNLGSASSHVKSFNDDYSKFAAAPFPMSLQGYNVHPNVPPSILMMLKSSKNKEAAWKFMTFFATQYNDAYGKLYGEIPPTIDAMKADWIQNTPYFKTGAALMLSTTTKFTDNPIYLPGYTSIQKNMEPMIQNVMTKKISAKELLDKWAKQLEEERHDFIDNKESHTN